MNTNARHRTSFPQGNAAVSTSVIRTKPFFAVPSSPCPSSLHCTHLHPLLPHSLSLLEHPLHSSTPTHHGMLREFCKEWHTCAHRENVMGSRVGSLSYRRWTIPNYLWKWRLLPHCLGKEWLNSTTLSTLRCRIRKQKSMIM